MVDKMEAKQIHVYTPGAHEKIQDTHTPMYTSQAKQIQDTHTL